MPRVYIKVQPEKGRPYRYDTKTLTMHSRFAPSNEGAAREVALSRTHYGKTPEATKNLREPFAERSGANRKRRPPATAAGEKPQEENGQGH